MQWGGIREGRMMNTGPMTKGRSAGTQPVKTETVEEKPVRAENPWMIHVKQFRADHPELKYKEVLQQAKATYTKKEKSV